MHDYRKFVPILFSSLRCYSCFTGEQHNETIQGDLELRADCKNNGSVAQSSLYWNPASLSPQVYNDDTDYNFNFEYYCYNISSDKVAKLFA